MRIAAKTAIRVIHQADGVACLAHPVWYDQWEPILDDLAGSDLDAVEARHPEHTPELERRVTEEARRLGLAISAGSDYHEPDQGRWVGQCTLDDRELARLEERRPGSSSSGSPG